MRPNGHGVRVWMHDFDWPYRQRLESAVVFRARARQRPLAAGAGGNHDRRTEYADAAHLAFEPLRLDVAEGGVLVTDASQDIWIEEYIVDPPTHILNGFIWALWGVFDYARWSGRSDAFRIWEAGVATLAKRLADFDTGWWSLYEARDGSREMLASRYYHTLHITQLRVMHRLTGIDAFSACADRFQTYLDRPSHRALAFGRKAIFKLRHY